MSNVDCYLIYLFIYSKLLFNYVIIVVINLNLDSPNNTLNKVSPFDFSLSICDPKTGKHILFHAYTSLIYGVNAWKINNYLLGIETCVLKSLKYNLYFTYIWSLCYY